MQDVYKRQDKRCASLNEDTKQYLLREVNKLRLEKNNEFAIKEVYDLSLIHIYNHKKLMKGDDKFYMLSINPSQDEAAHLIRKVTGKQAVSYTHLPVLHSMATDISVQSQIPQPEPGVWFHVSCRFLFFPAIAGPRC